MISLSSIALAVALTAGASEVAGAPCRDSIRATRGFGLALDWKRAAEPRAQARRLLRPVSATDPSTRTAALDCVLATAAAPSRRIGVPARVAPQRVLPEPASTSAPDDGPVWLRPFAFFAGTAGVYDSNIDQDRVPIRDYGTVFSVGTHFETDAVQVEYEVASHSYQNTDRWDRISHSLTSSYEQKITRKLSLEAVGNLALKGSSEDRELGDQYVFEPRIHYRLSPSNRLRLYGAYRLRRYDENPERDATNRYAGVELRHRLGRTALDIGYRWETNRAEGPRFTYDRQTYSAQLSTPLAGGRHRLGLEVRYRPQQYAHRFLDNGSLRRDKRWIFSAGGSFALGRHVELLPGYKFETRSSNDPDKKFDAHVAYLGLRYWFGGRGNPSIARQRPADRPETAARKDERTSGEETSPPKNREATQVGSNRTAPIARSKAVTSAEPQPPPRSNPAPLSLHRPSLPAATRQEWSRRAEADRGRLLRGEMGLYAIELLVSCDLESLEDAWSHDSMARALWLIPGGSGCYRLFWGHFSSEREAKRAARSIPLYFRSLERHPVVVAIASPVPAVQSNFPIR